MCFLSPQFSAGFFRLADTNYLLILTYPVKRDRIYKANKNKTSNLKQEECVNNLTHEQLELIKEHASKSLDDLMDCYIKNYGF